MKKVLWKFVFAILAVFIAVNIFKWANSSYKTEIAMSGTLEKSFALDGIVVRDEEYVSTKSKGVLEAKTAEGEIVKNGKMVGNIYYGDIDDETKKKLVVINQRIAEINSAQNLNDSYTNDIHKIESNIASKVNDLTMAAVSKDVSRVAALKTDINILLDKKSTVSGSKSDAQTTLEDLQAQKKQIESMYDAAKDDLYAPMPGRFSTLIDGYEKIITPKAVKKITVDEYNELKKAKPDDSEKSSAAVCKIINNFEWQIVTVASDSLVSKLKEGSEVYIRFENQPDAQAYVSYISPQDNGRYVVCITSSAQSDYAMENRFVKFEIITAKYSGIKVPVDAVRVIKNQKGVYTVSGGVKKFKQADIIYSNSKYAIISEQNNKANYLRLYDEVIVSDKNKD